MRLSFRSFSTSFSRMRVAGPTFASPFTTVKVDCCVCSTLSASFSGRFGMPSLYRSTVPSTAAVARGLAMDHNLGDAGLHQFGEAHLRMLYVPGQAHGLHMPPLRLAFFIEHDEVGGVTFTGVGHDHRIVGIGAQADPAFVH